MSKNSRFRGCFLLVESRETLHCHLSIEKGNICCRGKARLAQRGVTRGFPLLQE